MKNQKGGFIGLIVLIIIALVVLKYLYNFSVFEAAGTPQGQETIGYTQQILSWIWSIIGPTVVFIQNKIFLPLVSVIWDNFKSFIDWGRMNAASGIQ